MPCQPIINNADKDKADKTSKKKQTQKGLLQWLKSNQ
jgi:hypothetical protein